MLRIIHGNRCELLVAALLQSSAAEPPPAALEQVLQPELVLVPSAGMGRWLTFEIARRRGIACNIRFRFVAGFVWELFARLLPDIPAESPFDPPVMAWRLYEAFAALPDVPDYAPLRAYLARGDARSRMDLAQKIAEVYALYLVYRPDWLEAWRGATTLALEPADVQQWQARLWRDVLAPAARHREAHPQDAALGELRRRVEQGDRRNQHAGAPGQLGATLDGLPPVLRVFGIPSMAPLYVRVLARLAEVIDVEIYALDPCREYWADIVSEKELARRRLEDGLVGDPADDHFDVGHPLLASWGKQARDNLALLIALAGEPGAIEDACFCDPAGEAAEPQGESPLPQGESPLPQGESALPQGESSPFAGGCLLHRLQRSILDLAPLELPSAPDDAVLGHDRSLQVHACHSLTRQLEVLHDQLLALFDRLPGLIPSEIVVMLPDLDSAAPLIEAVFDTVPRERRIAFAIRGRAAADATPLLRAFATMLGWPRSRMEAAALAEFLQVPAVARRFGLDAPDLELVDRWLRDTGVRWGLDAAHRAQFGVPAEERHTLAEGLSRVLLGYALPGQGRGALQGLLPYDEVEGSSALTAGKLARAVAEIGAAAAELRAARSVAAWCGYLVELLARMFDVQDQDDEQIELQRVRDAIAALGAGAARGEAGADVPCDVIAQCLALEIGARAPGAVPTGSVTFCGIGPLRGVPYRVVCMLGMDDGAFPRHPSPSEFDLMAHRPRLGDRARHADDRGSFLDALLAAREIFYVAYTGRSARDNAPLPPSILVSELLDFLDRGLAQSAVNAASNFTDLREQTARRARVRAQILTEHRLQPFSPRYFDGGQLFSYAREYLAAAGAATVGAASAAGGADRASRLPARGRGILDAPLPVPDEEWRTVATDDLARYLCNPVGYVLQRRLRIEIAQAQQELPGAEPFVLDRPGEWSLGERLLQGLLAGLAPDAALRLGLAGPELPHGAPAQVLVRRELDKAQAFIAALRTLEPPEPLEPLATGPERAFELPIEIPPAPDGTAPAVTLVLRGTLTGLSSTGRFGWRYSAGGYHTRVRAWIDHLALCALAPAGVAHRTAWLCQDGVFRYGAVPQPLAQLATLLQVYWRGLVQPPRFMPKTASALLDYGEHKAAMQWHDEFHDRGELLDPWYELGFGEPEDSRIPQQLRDLAQIVVAPMRAALLDDQDSAH